MMSKVFAGVWFGFAFYFCVLALTFGFCFGSELREA